MANEYLKRQPTSSGNSRRWTISFWMKNSDPTQGYTSIIGAGKLSPSNVYNEIFYTSSQIGLNLDNASATGNYNITANPLLRDPSAWMHVIVSFTDQGDNANTRLKFYINGAFTDHNTGTGLDVSETSFFNHIGYIQYIGSRAQQSAGTTTFDGQYFDVFLVDGQTLTPDVFGFYKDGDGYISVGSTQSTDFKPGQWSPHSPTKIKKDVNSRGGFGVNGFYLPMNSSNNPGADFHCTPDTILKLKEDLPQPKAEIDGVGDYTGALRDDPFKQYLVLAVPGVIGGLDNGYGDYSGSIKGSGSNKSATASGNFAMTNLSSYYGSVMRFSGSGNSNADGGVISMASSPDFNLGLGDFTLEGWINAHVNAQDSGVFGIGSGGAEPFLSFTSGTLRFRANGGAIYITNPNGVAIEQWHHVVLESHNTVLSLIVNGVVVGTANNSHSFSEGPALIGSWTTSRSYGFNGDVQDVRLYKGIAKYKGGFDVPKPYTPVGIEAFRTTADTCKNNFATLNPLVTGQNSPAHSDGNLLYSNTQGQSLATTGISSGKMYWEVYVTNTNAGIGVAVGEVDPADYVGKNTTSWAYYVSGGKYTNYISHSTVSSYGASYTAGDIIGVSLDCDSGNLTYYKNGVSQGVAFTGFDDGRTYFPTVGSADSAFKLNFGQNPSFSGNTTAGTNADDSGKGLFKYAPPTGFLALCEDNLPTPAIADPGKHFKCVLYNGKGTNGSDGSQSVRKVGFQPDLVWVKKRDTAGDHKLVDSVRGSGQVLESNTADPQGNENNNFTGFNFDGFDLGANNAGAWNESPYGYVAWCWKAGGPAVTNTEGTITTQVSANPEAGFSIVKSDGPGTSGHGLNSTPKWIIQKSLTSGNWNVQHHLMMTTSTGKLLLNSTSNVVSSSTPYMHNATATTFETIFSGNQIAYVWAEIKGFSKFGSYVGNGNADGTFVYCGFKPAWVLIKRLDASGYYWTLFDSSRKPTNPADHTLNPNLAHTEETSGGNGQIDLLSNGFKCRNVDSGINGNGGFFIFVAFAESPFQTANAK